MTDINRGLFVPLNGGVGTTSIQGRLALAGVFAENSNGVPRDGLIDPTTTTVVTGNGSTMSFDIPAINVIRNRTAGEGPYVFSSSGTTNTTTTSAPVGNPRIDLIWVKQNDVAKGDADNKAITGVTQGTPAASPVAPYGSVPTGAYVLAEATFQTTATKGSDASIVQVWRYTAPRGVPIKVRNTTERAELTARAGLQVVRLDLDATGGAIEQYSGAAWVPLQRREKHIVNDSSSQVGTPTGVAAKVASGEIQLVHYFCTFVGTTDSSGYLAHSYSTAFPNGVFEIQVSNGDSAQGRGDVYAAAGTPFSQNLSTCYISVANAGGSTGKASATVRCNIDVWGW